MDLVCEVRDLDFIKALHLVTEAQALDGNPLKEIDQGMCLPCNRQWSPKLDFVSEGNIAGMNPSAHPTVSLVASHSALEQPHVIFDGLSN